MVTAELGTDRAEVVKFYKLLNNSTVSCTVTLLQQHITRVCLDPYSTLLLSAQHLKCVRTSVL